MSEEKLCRWDQEDIASHLWLTGCKRIYDGKTKPDEFKFCPFCGKPIIAIQFEEYEEAASRELYTAATKLRMKAKKDGTNFLGDFPNEGE